MRLSPAASKPRFLVVALALLGVLFLAQAQEGEIRIAMQYDHGTFDPQLLTSVTDKQMSANLFDGLVQYELGTTNVEPDLATDWEMSADGRQWTFNLRQDVEFHHGYGPFTASDVVFTFERLLDSEFNSPNAALMQSIESVDARSDHQVVFNLAEPDPAFLDKLANWFSYIVSEKAVADKGDTFGDDPVGTGLYQFESWTPQQQTVLGAFPEAWSGTAGLASVVYVPIPDATTMYNAFEAADVDMIQVTDPDKLARYENDDSLEVHAVPGLITRFFGMKSDSGPLAEPLVREAITYAIDRDSMLKFVFKGISTPADSILAPGVQHVKRNVVNYQFDPERAKELLAEAGYPDGFKVTYTVPNIDRFSLPATIIQENLRAVGIDMEIVVMETQAFLADLRSEQGLEMFSLSRSQDATPDRVLYSWHHTVDIPGNNWSRIDIPEVDEWLDEAVTTLDEERRAELFGLVQERVAAGNYYYYIDHENMIFAVRDRVQGYVADPQRSIRLDKVTVAD